MDNFNIEIIYEDEYLAVINKPVDLPIHKNDFMPHDAPYLNKLVGNITGKNVFNVHRIDAKTSGIVIVAFSSEIAKKLTLQFEQKKVEKKYIAIVLGNTEDEGEFTTKVLVKKKAKFKKDAVTRYKKIKTVFTGIVHKEYENTPISLVEVVPLTGRWHQIRQHFAQHRHDIIGDTHHGDFSFNKKITEINGVKRLFLHAKAISFTHPVSEETISFESELPVEFQKFM